MRIASPEKPIARTILLYTETFQCLRPVRQSLEMASFSEVIRTALGQYEDLIYNAFDEQKPSLLFLHTDDGREIDVLNYLHGLTSGTKPTRLNITCSPQTIQRIDDLEVITKAPLALISHRAIKLLELIATHQHTNNCFFRHYTNGEKQAICFTMVPLPSRQPTQPEFEAYLANLRRAILYPAATSARP